LSLRHRLSILAAFASAVVAIVAAPTAAAAEGNPFPPYAHGTDISWPQCNGPMPADQSYGFAIVGVTGGAPMTSNPCLEGEYAWAVYSHHPQLYMNLDYGQIANGPLHCAAADTGCQAYNYGYYSAQWAVGNAIAATGGLSTHATSWWLDVETENNWSGSTDENSYVIQGALDYMQRQAGLPVGIYSTAYQWGQIAGSFAPPGIPNWVAGAASLGDGGLCSQPLWPGGQVYGIQYLNFDLNLDQDVGC
jgi:hypothetical protein